MDLRERAGGAHTARHPWETARAAFFLRVLRETRMDFRAVLDVGAGDGYLAARMRDELLAPGARQVLWDSEYSAADLAALARAGLTATRERPVGPFDLLLLADVLEHADDAAALLAGALAVSAPGAHVLVSVPAWPALWSTHDVALRHRRRYRAREARALLEGAGLTVREHGGVFHSLMLPRAAAVVAERLAGRRADGDAGPGVGAWRGGRLTSALVSGALRAEQRLLARPLSRRGVDIAGLSWWALAHR